MAQRFARFASTAGGALVFAGLGIDFFTYDGKVCLFPVCNTL
jgi:hypothetical protein